MTTRERAEAVAVQIYADLNLSGAEDRRYIAEIVERAIVASSRQFAVALRDAAVHINCRRLWPDDECRMGRGATRHRCNRARRLIGVPAGMLAKLEDDNGR